MLKLRAYSEFDLQKFANILNAAEGQGLSIPDVRAQVTEAIAVLRKPIRQEKVQARIRQRKQSAPQKKCPEKGCGGMMRLILADESMPEIGAWECKKCRYSIFEGKTFQQLAGEVNNGS